MREVLAEPRETWEGVEVLRGHYYYDLCERLPPEFHLLTILREPVARTVSNIKHAIRNQPSDLQRDWSDLMDDETFIIERLANLQVRLLGAQLPEDVAHWPADIHQPIVVGEEQLDLAWERLQKGSFALSEEFTASVRRIAEPLGLKGTLLPPKKNVSPQRQKLVLNAYKKKKLRDFNEWDVKLYERAKSCWRRQS